MKRRTVSVYLAVVLAVGLPGCGGGSSPSSPTAVATPTPAPTPAPPVVLLNGNFALDVDFIVAFRTVSVTTSGVMEITVDWTFAKNDIDVALVRGTCTQAMFEADTCDFVAFADSLTAKPEKLRVNVTAGTYTPMAVNFGPDNESGVVQVVFTAGAATTSQAASRSFKPKRRIQYGS